MAGLLHAKVINHQTGVAFDNPSVLLHLYLVIPLLINLYHSPSVQIEVRFSESSWPKLMSTIMLSPLLCFAYLSRCFKYWARNTSKNTSLLLID